MADIFTPEKRSNIMSKIKGKNTKPEMTVRSTLHRMGYRYMIHDKILPGSPDIVLSRHKKIIFVHGCFWHGHAGCKRAAMPESNFEFWNKKISRNIERDNSTERELRSFGWQVLIIWQCQTKDPDALRMILRQYMRS